MLIWGICRSGFYSLLFSSYAHIVGFSACFFLATPSFRYGTSWLVSSLGFSAWFSLQKPTTCVFSLDFSSLHPFSAMEPLDENRLYINQLHKKWHIQRNPPNMPLNQPIPNIIYQNYAHTYHKYDIPKYNRHLTRTIAPENSKSSSCLFLLRSQLPMLHLSLIHISEPTRPY